MPTEKLTDYLDSQQVRYKVIEHDLAYTAQETAASAHIPGRQLAKSVMVKLDDSMVMAVLPAPYRVNLDILKDSAGAVSASLVSEQQFREKFPDCEAGAMPPFGHLYGIDVYADESLSEEMLIAFCAGSHSELIQMSFDDFKRLAKPKIMDFAYQS